ncbi:sensor histidine kinase [Streptomyces sp. NBC_01190]|uniref:sensor histidine kinase n=1 Tax=Streptomyces sp. NBC_01190 TaxID=2903767 RepID=UPI00386FC3FE|nr:HAMP domain-containing histidine kinase [Streptomyces sp. NBC_01190]
MRPRGFWPRPHSLRGRLTIANVVFLGVGLLLAAAASITATYMVLVGQIDGSLKSSQTALQQTSLTEHGMGQFCTLADLLQSDRDGGPQLGKAFQQDLFIVLDKHGKAAGVCHGAMPVSDEQRRLAAALPDPAKLARSGDAATVTSGPREYRVVAVRLPDGTIVVKGMRLSGVKRAIGKLLIVETAVGAVLLGLLATGSLTAARRRLSPLEDMVATASAIAEGDLSRRIGTARHGSSEVEELSSSLNAMLQQIEAALTESERATAQQRQFLADASHELRTPLASVRGYLQLYEKGMLDAEEKERALTRVSAEALRMSCLVDELLALARLEDRPGLTFCPVDLSGLVQDAAADLAAQQPERPLTLLLPDGPTGPTGAAQAGADADADADGDGGVVAGPGRPYALGDEAGLRQVVGNLLANVRVHTPAESPVTIAVEGCGEAELRLRISDSGPGLSEKDAARAFDRFFRADPERARETGGAGLGMSIVQALVHAHHGTVTLHTAPGAGLTVRVTLPAATSAPTSAATPVRAGTPAGPAGSGSAPAPGALASLP